MKTYKILIVEDDETIASSVEKQLTCWDYETKCVQDFSKVLDTFLAFSPELVLLPCRFLTAFTGAGKSVIFPKCRSFFCPPRQII